MGMMTAAIGGAVGGLAVINVLAYKAKTSNNPCDLREFSSDQEVLAKVATWASGNGYGLQSDQDGKRVYRKGVNFLTSPMYLEIQREGNRYTTRSYVQVNGLIIKGDLALTAKGVVAKVPRASALKAQNRLFAELGQPVLG